MPHPEDLAYFPLRSLSCGVVAHFALSTGAREVSREGEEITVECNGISV